jgi:ABC-2 type transport system ATP-binding protein
MIEVVGLTPAEAKRRVRDYSLGMRQRLGIAHALLGDPSILILDEPANGLDPAGIHWMRGLLRDFADRGGTVLLSSHLLNEVEIVADEMILIGGGRILAQGSKADLLRASGAYVKATEPVALEHALRRAGVEITSSNGAIRADVEPVLIGQIAASVSIALIELRPDGAGLEEMFLDLTAETQREGVSA